jgi:HD-like signal output (HDOD) protein
LTSIFLRQRKLSGAAHHPPPTGSADNTSMTSVAAPQIHPALAKSLQALFERPAALPTLPRVVQSLIASFQKDDVSAQTIAAQLETDPVLSARTLRLANSAYFHVSRSIQNLDAALRMLGFVMVRNLVLAAGIGQACRHVKGLDLRQFWRHSLCTAGGARWLAGKTEVNTDLAFMTGLIQGLGHLVLRSGDASTMAMLDSECAPLKPLRAECELRVLGFHHGHVAAELARRWKFPAVIADTLGAVPEAGKDGDGPLLCIVRTAVWNAVRECLPATDTAASLPQPPGQLPLAWQGTPPVLSLLIGRQGPLPVPAMSELTAELEGLFEDV